MQYKHQTIYYKRLCILDKTSRLNNYKERANINSIQPLPSFLLIGNDRHQIFDFVSQLVDFIRVSRVFVHAELLEELAKGHLAVTIKVVVEGVHLAHQHCRLRRLVSRQFLGQIFRFKLFESFAVQGPEEPVDCSGLSVTQVCFSVAWAHQLKCVWLARLVYIRQFDARL